MESPQYVRLSAAADMTLGFSPAVFYKNVRLYCINLLLHYPDGCKANCLYCGQAREAAGSALCKSLIRVEWPLRRLEDVIERFRKFLGNGNFLRPYRICVATISHPMAIRGEVDVIKRISESINVPISALISPTIFTKPFMEKIKAAGAERIGIAVDCATPQLFNLLRGKGARGPHRWEVYLKGIENAKVVGEDKVGVHLIIGLGESEREAVRFMQEIKERGAETHLFSFYPEEGSVLESWPRPPISQYRRMQIARYLIDNEISTYGDMSFNQRGQLVNYGLNVKYIAETGEPFMTSGCPGCNRPFSNERPGESMRNYPYLPSRREAVAAQSQAKKYATPKNTIQHLKEYLRSVCARSRLGFMT